jgi:hypothetical protein
MYSVYLKKKTERSETALRNSAVRYSLFYGSPLKLGLSAIEAADLIALETSICGVLYERESASLCPSKGRRV